MSDKIKLFNHELKECEKKPEGIPRTLCQLSVFAEKHPKLAKLMVDVACSAMRTGIKHPKIIKAVSRLI
ncbi:MAG: hypothetical protein ACTSUF_03755 [Candidatus Heimdallarchaeaceae archaeon]